MAANAGKREAEIVKAYLAGKKITEMEAQFGVQRSTIYHILRRQGQLPKRRTGRMQAETVDAVMAGLYEMIEHQDKLIGELRVLLAKQERELRKLRPANNGTTPSPQRKAKVM